MLRIGVNNLKVWAALLAAAMSAAAIVAALVVGTKPAGAAFPSSAGDIAFTSNRDGPLGLYRMGSDGFSPQRYQPFVQGNSNLPAWSADGTRVAFTNDTGCFVNVSCSEPNLDVYWTTADHSNGSRTSTVSVGSLATETEASWFPSGNRIAFRSDRSGGGDIYAQGLGLNGHAIGSPVRLTKKAAFDGQPTVSPDGTKIAFSSTRSGNGDIYVMKAAPESATNVPKRLTTSNSFEGYPDWSPNGKQMVFQRGSDFGFPEIIKMNANGTGQTNLTKDPSADLDPVFSPDGKKIAFDSNRDGDREIWRMRADGSSPVNLTNNSVIDANPSWQPIP